MSLQEIKKLKELLQRLETEDKNLRVFGASGHKYKLRPTLSKSELQEFEQTYQVKLPEDYRFFLKEIGNGGAGPGYGLYPLSKTTDNFRPDVPFSLASLSPLTDGWQSIPLIDDALVPGIIEIETRGCAHATYLVVNGDTYGTIWNCWSIDEILPTGLSFSAWYWQWVDKMEKKALPILAREREAERIREGMSLQEAVDTLGGQWHIKEDSWTNRRFLVFDGLATNFKIDENDIIVESFEWDIIVW